MTLNFTETYRTAAISINHLNDMDQILLKKMMEGPTSLVAERPAGYFIKLHKNAERNAHDGLTKGLQTILVSAAKQGFECIEVDLDAVELNGAATYN
ncbi:hypothetical protein AB6D11_00625 [Vibrio splendidus]